MAEFEDLRNEMINFKTTMTRAMTAFNEGTVAALEEQGARLRVMEERLHAMAAELAELESRSIARAQEREQKAIAKAKTKVG